jgi:hypothetical protein
VIPNHTKNAGLDSGFPDQDRRAYFSLHIFIHMVRLKFNDKPLISLLEAVINIDMHLFFICERGSHLNTWTLPIMG